MAIKIKENIDFQDFMEVNFPKVLKPFYTKRIFIINIMFGVLYFIIAGYVFYQTYKNHGKLENVHYSFLIFGLVFFILAYYLSKREIKVYKRFVDKMNDLETTYTIDENGIQVINKENQLSYLKKEIEQIRELPKWLVFYFKNDEKISIYKPNATNEQLAYIHKTYSSLFF